MLRDTKLAVSLDPRTLTQLMLLGRERDLAPAEKLFDAGSETDKMYVVLSGDLVVGEDKDAFGTLWTGPGDLVGEIGFILGVPRTLGVRAGPHGVRLWELERRFLTGDTTPRVRIALTRLMLALAPYVRVRRAQHDELANRPDDLLTHHCDHDHPSIRRLAGMLRRDTPWATTEAIYRYVRSLPYRIGRWQLKASRTLQLGYGMCTTKSNLQAALSRAVGLNAMVAEISIPSSAMTPLLPEGYHAKVLRKPTLKHYLGIIEIDGCWTPVDATYSPEVWQLYKEHAEPEIAARVILEMDRGGRCYNPVHVILQRDPWDVEVLSDLSHVMDKKPFYNDDNIEAMNIRLDRAQGAFHDLPRWVHPVEDLLRIDPEAAFYRAYAGISSEIERLRTAIRHREAAGRVEDQEEASVI